MTEIALIGKKIGMSREFYKTGQSVPVTVLKMEKGRVIQIIDIEKRGYKAVQIGFGKIKSSKVKEMSKIIREVMAGVESSDHHKFTVPLLIDLNSGENWGMLH